nr:unnamed protein product [Callosobruchus chinensis]
MTSHWSDPNQWKVCVHDNATSPSAKKKKISQNICENCILSNLHIHFKGVTRCIIDHVTS